MPNCQNQESSWLRLALLTLTTLRRRLLYHVLPRVIDLIDGGAHTAAGSAAAGRPASRRQRRRNKRRPLRDEMTDREA